MTVIHEETACSNTTGPPFRRTLKVMLSPVLNKEVEDFAAGYTILPPGETSDYTHHPEGEMFCVVSGRGEIKGEEGSFPLETGTMAWCPPFDFHQLVNTGKKTMKVLWLLIPPGREEGIIELSKMNMSRKQEREK